MNCFKEEVLQQYSDGEYTPEERMKIESHLIDCETCSSQLETVKQRSQIIKEKLNVLVNEVPEIPGISTFITKKEKHISRRRKLVYSLAAACILLFAVLIIGKQNSNEKEPMLFYNMDYNVDANKPITDMEMVFYITDENGNIIENDLNL